MLEKNLTRVYNKFKLHLYGQFLREPDEKQEDSLSVQEIVYLELIIALRRPTINDFAHYAGLSGPNAAYRINRLINPALESIYLRSDDPALSSSMVRELLAFDRPVDAFVPEAVAAMIAPKQ